MDYVKPNYSLDQFNCPHCSVYAHQYWINLYYDLGPLGTSNRSDYRVATCYKCKQPTIWYKDTMIYPLTSTAPKPHPDMPSEIKPDYDEARNIVSLSPRSSCVLLRLCIEKLCNTLVSGNGDLNEKIGKLVEKGLDPDIQQALDSVRVIGGEAVHPLQMDLKDDAKTATALFSIVNHIITYTISKSKQIKDIYDLLPDNKKKAIQTRDSKKP